MRGAERVQPPQGLGLARENRALIGLELVQPLLHRLATAILPGAGPPTRRQLLFHGRRRMPVRCGVPRVACATRRRGRAAAAKTLRYATLVFWRGTLPVILLRLSAKATWLVRCRERHTRECIVILDLF